eukprot:6213604-Pleurochrysis_carterae.AAC.4
MDAYGYSCDLLHSPFLLLSKYLPDTIKSDVGLQGERGGEQNSNSYELRRRYNQFTFRIWLLGTDSVHVRLALFEAFQEICDVFTLLRDTSTCIHTKPNFIHALVHKVLCLKLSKIFVIYSPYCVIRVHVFRRNPTSFTPQFKKAADVYNVHSHCVHHVRVPRLTTTFTGIRLSKAASMGKLTDTADRQCEAGGTGTAATLARTSQCEPHGVLPPLLRKGAAVPTHAPPNVQCGTMWTFQEGKYRGEDEGGLGVRALQPRCCGGKRVCTHGHVQLKETRCRALGTHGEERERDAHAAYDADSLSKGTYPTGHTH